ncbi:MAG: primosomal protein N' [Acidobacteria bacterium]|nr:primosomal protein N' [Acidobacteriota bacterium]MBI3278751.1 primosomal protein N' [Acidobacteriota bacterium]
MQPVYADVSLPVPLDRLFTYRLPETMRHRVQPGCRLLVPFGSRKLTGTVLRTHDEAPAMETREALRLLDEAPALEPGLIRLAEWIASYYVAPLGEVLRVMTPLSGDLRTKRVYELTDIGRDAARRFPSREAAEDPAVRVLHLLEQRSLSAAYLEKKVENSRNAVRSLEKKGFVRLVETQEDRDPLRAVSERLRIEYLGWPPDVKLKKPERELLSYLELHPGSHNLAAIESSVAKASQSARALARRKLLRLSIEPPAVLAHFLKPPPTLNEAQRQAFDTIRSSIEAKQFKTFLLRGVTGSGKTEVYMRAIEAAHAAGRNTLLLVPEIALTPAMAAQFYHRFGDRVAILHSAFHETERADQWRRIRTGVATVVVGTRSAVFAPVQDLGLIVVDEEHDHSYKQQETPRYHGRDVAVVRAQMAGATVVLGSATPSLESRHNVERGKYTGIELPERIEQRPMPEVELIDMRLEFLETGGISTFSRRLLAAIEERLETGEQVMLLHNRRGFSSFMACRACGERMQCVNCSVTMTLHRRDRRMLCHYCDHSERVPNACPKCFSDKIQFLGVGSERVEDELHNLFPKARITRLDRDSASAKRRFESILHGFREGSYDILVGTQMIAKGHDIPNVTLVGVVNADIGLALPDFRAAERTFQLLTQVAGRAGRGEIPGKVLVQTLSPDHWAIRMAARHDFEAFYQREIHFRRQMRYPPFVALASVLVRGPKQEEALRLSGELAHFLNPPPEQVRVLGPAEAPVLKLRNDFRYQLLIKAASRRVLAELLHKVRDFARERDWPATALVIDVDPASLM